MCVCGGVEKVNGCESLHLLGGRRRCEVSERPATVQAHPARQWPLGVARPRSQIYPDGPPPDAAEEPDDMDCEDQSDDCDEDGDEEDGDEEDDEDEDEDEDEDGYDEVAGKGKGGSSQTKKVL